VREHVVVGRTQHQEAARGRFGKADRDGRKGPRAVGCEGIRIGAAKELRPAPAQALTARVPVLIDCPVDYRENDRLGKM